MRAQAKSDGGERPILPREGRTKRGGVLSVPGAETSIPVVRHFETMIEGSDRQRLERLAQAILSGDPRLGSTEAFGPNVRPGFQNRPNLVMEDHSEIRLYETAGNAYYAYRALLLAGDGDKVALDVPRVPGFERYCRETLKLGRIDLIRPEGNEWRNSITMRCVKDGVFLERAAQMAREAGGLNILPYMSTGGAWRLAAEISHQSKAEICVVGPPPRLTQCVNDKVWFAELLAKALGPQALPPSYSVFGPAALAYRISALARRFPALVVKIPNSASSTGNLIYESQELSGISLRSLKEQVTQQLRQRGWGGEFPLIVTAWESPLISSPSVQIWIPNAGDADPIIEGIFDQALIGEQLEFAGAAPAELPGPTQECVARDAIRLAYLLQCLGYYGRCSFDGILVGQDGEATELHWVECNGRWGGVSIPMTLVNRLTGDWRRHPFVISDRSDLHGHGRRFEDLLAQFKDNLFLPGDSEEGLIFLSPSRMEDGTGFEVLYIAPSVAKAQAGLDGLLPHLQSQIG